MLDLDEIKNAPWRPYTGEAALKAIDQLTQEVKRLREIECCDVFIRHHGGSTLAETVLEDMEKDKIIESLTNELEELKHKITRGPARIQELEAENAKLKEELHLIDQRVRQGLAEIDRSHGKTNDPA